MSLLRGWLGEKKSSISMWLSLNSRIYQRFHNLIIPSANGTTQIDHVVVSRYGVFIIETKNKGGWIFGCEKSSKWTQTLFHKKYSFQNPLRQTFRQKKILSEFLAIPEPCIQPVIHFVGDCSFKTPMPDNVLTSGLSHYIKKFRTPVLNSQQVNEIGKKIKHHISTSSLTTRDHLKSLKDRHNSSTSCPKCGSKLVQRVARTGKFAGSRFQGCENYPRCRFTRNI